MLVWGFFVSTVACYHGTYTINSLCHVWGRRRYATGDESRNNFWLALITLGEGWHNNHHRYPMSARQGFYWWEVDLTYYGLRAPVGAGPDLGPQAGAARGAGRPHGGGLVRVAVVGAGVAGLHAAWRLSRAHEVTLFEAADYAGGHTATVDVPWGDRSFAVDTGFIVFNDWTYPNFIATARGAGRRLAVLEHELQRCAASAAGSSTTAPRSTRCSRSAAMRCGPRSCA